MKAFKKMIITGLLFGILIGCGSSVDSASNFIESGKELLAEGQIKKARLEFKNAIQVDPRQAEPFYQLALLDEKEQKWKAMFANLTTVEQLDPTHYDAIVKLGQIHLLAGNFDIALEKANKVIEADKSNVLAWVLRASIAMKQKKYESAMNDVEHALSLDSKNIETLSVKTLILNLQGNPKQALLVIDDALKIKPDQLALVMIKLSVLEGQKDYVAMEQVYQGLLTLRPDESWVAVSLAKLLNAQDRYMDAKNILESFVSAHVDDKEAKLLLVSLVSTKEPEQAIILLDGYIEHDQDHYELRSTKAKLQLDNGHIDETIETLKQIKSLDTEGEYGRNARVMLAGFDFQQGNMESALVQLQEVLTIDPENEGALLLKAQIEIANKDIDTAVTHLRLVLRNNPESDKALVLLAQSYMNSGSTELAEDNFRQALVVNPSNTLAALSVADSLMKAKDLDRTEAVLTKALKNAKNKEPLLQALAQVQLLKKDWDNATTSIDSLRVDSGDTALTYYLSGQVFQGQSLFESAITEYKAALAEQPNMVRALHGLSYSYMQLSKKEGLISYLDEFSQSNPSQLAGYEVLSSIHMQDKNWDDAIAAIEQGIAKEPKWQRGFSILASIYYAQNKTEQAISAYKRGLDNIKNSTLLSMQLASAYEGVAEFDKAKTLYEEVLARDSSIEPAINNLVSLLVDRFNSEENLNKAMMLAERFKTATEPYYLDTYAWTHVLLGNFDKAQGVLERVVSLAPNVAVFNYHIGALYLKQGNKIEAENYLNIAKSLAVKQGDTFTAEKVTELLGSL
jgi:tetratricopeptide (TPR) repeat protein